MVTWIGVKKHIRRGIVRFENFRCFGNNGPNVKDALPTLALRMRKVRHTIIEYEDEVERFVEEFAGDAPASRDCDAPPPCCRSARTAC
jgi:hypothetical protein